MCRVSLVRELKGAQRAGSVPEVEEMAGEFCPVQANGNDEWSFCRPIATPAELLGLLATVNRPGLSFALSPAKLEPDLR